MYPSLMGAPLVVGIDFSEGCEWALRRAVNLAELSHARLKLVHVVAWDDLHGLAMDASSADDEAGPQWPALSGYLQAFLGQLEQLCAYLVADRVPAQTQVLLGEPAAGLLLAAEQSAAAVIVLGAQGRGRTLGPARGVVGSTAAQVYTTSPIPVLLDFWPQPVPEAGQRYLFLSPADPQGWSCFSCGTVQRSPGAAARACTACGDPSCTWISLAHPSARRGRLSTPGLGNLFSAASRWAAG